jgi:hypothetical protein
MTAYHMDNDMAGNVEEHAAVTARMTDIGWGTLAGTEVATSASQQ